MDREYAGPESHWAGARYILVPPDIVAVPRQPRVRTRKRTPLRRGPAGEVTTRAGGREWLSDRIFVETQRAGLKAACSTSMTAHASCLIALFVVLVAQSDPLPAIRAGKSLIMPVLVSTLPVVEATSAPPAARPPAQPPTKTATAALAPPPPPPSPTLAAPAETPTSIEPETGHEAGASGAEGGVPGGISGGVGDGAAGGGAGEGLGGGSGSGAASTGPLRLGAGMEHPRKIKDVKPVYPASALSEQTRGAVVVEATVGVDGKVVDAKVIRSVPQLDQAALDAVRQWEFVPARLNGRVVAVIITVVVSFAIF